MDKELNKKLHSVTRYTADFIKSKTGKGPKKINIDYFNNKILLEIQEYLTPLEIEIAYSPEGVKMVRNARESFSTKYKNEYLAKVSNLLNFNVIKGSIVWDIHDNEAFIILKVNREI